MTLSFKMVEMWLRTTTGGLENSFDIVLSYDFETYGYNLYQGDQNIDGILN